MFYINVRNNSYVTKVVAKGEGGREPGPSPIEMFSRTAKN